MNSEDVKQHIHRWVENTLSVPSPVFDNLPPCPYSREAIVNNTVDIRCEHGSTLLARIDEIAKGWDDQYELILVASEPDTIGPEELIEGVQDANARFESSDLVCFFDHPNCTDARYSITSANGKYVLVGMQRLSNFLRAAKPLYKKNYFDKIKKQFPATMHLDRIDQAGD